VLETKLGGYEDRRLVEPICGRVDYDVAGTASGVWYQKSSSSTYPEDPHLALVYDNVDPSLAALSIGTFGPTGLYYFLPQNTGLVNRRFEDMKDSEIYCFDASTKSSSDSSLSDDQYQFILKLKKNKLSSEYLGTNTCGSGH